MKLEEDVALSGGEINKIMGHRTMSATWAFMSRLRTKLGKPKGRPIMRSELSRYLYEKVR